jgi:hypothetical protein
VFLIAYVLLAGIVGYLGKDSRLGFWGVSFGALIITPVAALLLVLLLGDRSDARDRRAQ